MRPMGGALLGLGDFSHINVGNTPTLSKDESHSKVSPGGVVQLTKPVHVLRTNEALRLLPAELFTLTVI